MTWQLRRVTAGLFLTCALSAVFWRSTSSLWLIATLAGVVASLLIVYGTYTFRTATSGSSRITAARPWILIATAIFLGSFVSLPILCESLRTGSTSWLSVAAYCAVSTLIVVGLGLMLKERYGQEQIRERFSESFLLATSLTYMAWLFVEQSMVTNPATLSETSIASGSFIHPYAPVARLAVMALPDIFALAIAGQIFLSFKTRPLAYRLLLLGTFAKVIGIVALLSRHERLEAHVITAFETFLFFVGFYALAALHPSMTRHNEQIQIAPQRTSRWRFIFLMYSLLAGPVLTGLLIINHQELGTASIMVGTAVLPLLITFHVLSLIRTGAVSEHQVRHDDLTGLPNRVLLGTRIKAALATAEKSGSPVALLYLDLDRFKTVNDSLGHASGNLLLQQVALRLKTSIEGDMSVARLSGDEFAVLIPQMRSENDAVVIGQKILDAFIAPIDLSRRQQVFITPSIGIAYSDSNCNTPEALLANADTALYQAKDRGRNRFEVFEFEMNARAQRRMTLEGALRGALDRHEFVLHYQPKVDLVSGLITGVEALVRWNHPEFGLLGPMEFIGIAEETGLIGPLGEWVLNEACRQAKHWVDIDFPPVSVAVNLSPRQFQVSPIADVVAKALRNSGLNASLLELEITESLAFYGEDRAIAVLQELREIGVTCAIDDFGTGYSSLSYLSRFPIDRLKIDKSFIKQITEKGGDAPLVTAIIAMAHSLGLEVVAEGVERHDQVHFLIEQGCDQIQGNLFSRPLPPDEIETLIMLEHIAPGQGRLSIPRTAN